MSEVTKICSKCIRELPATNKYFFKDSKKDDGLFKSCKECEGYIFQDMKATYQCADGFKICRKCKNQLLLHHDYFYYDKSKKDGFSNNCRVCDGSSYGKTAKDGYKICIKCDSELLLTRDNFHIDNSSKDRFDSICKNCKFNRNTDDFKIDNWYEKRSERFKSAWSLRDIRWMYENYNKITKRELLSYFNNEKSYKTLTNIIYQWNIKKQDKNDNWIKEDIQFLIKNYPNMPQKELEYRFSNRTWVAIKGKASKLNINRDEETLCKINSEAHKGIKPSEEARKKMSLSRRGKKAWNWKGGISPIFVSLRELTKPWKRDSLAVFNYNCALSGVNDRTLEIHHVNKNFSEIVYETFEILNLPLNNDMSKYTQEERDLIRDRLLELHYRYGLGIPLTRKLHQEFHSLYGVKNNTPEQFEEFKSNYFINKLYEEGDRRWSEKQVNQIQI